jgi:hypothetical protein
MSIRQTLFEFDPEINRLDSDRGSQEAQWTTVAVLRACSELTLFARFLSLVSGGVRRMFYLTFEIKHSPYHPVLKVSVPSYIYFPPTSKQLQQNKWRQIHPPYWSNIRQVALGNLECR